MVEVTISGKLVRGVVERVNDTILVTTRENQRSAPLNGRDPETVARDLLISLYAGNEERTGQTA
jgi:hypothetical protein